MERLVLLSDKQVVAASCQQPAGKGWDVVVKKL
jgi:hypothetical protein